MGVKIIQTSYDGQRFRSRLEARWAVFFNALGVVWEYEPEGFQMPDGTMYLPDFHLPTFDHSGVWCEVKHAGGDFSKAVQFARDSKCRLWICEGTPDFAIYKVLAQYEGADRPAYHCVVPNWSEAEGENRFYVWPCADLPCGRPCGADCDVDMHPIRLTEAAFSDSDIRTVFINAVTIARNARFEHGETPDDLMRNAAWAGRIGGRIKI